MVTKDVKVIELVTPKSIFLFSDCKQIYSLMCTPEARVTIKLEITQETK